MVSNKGKKVASALAALALCALIAVPKAQAHDMWVNGYEPSGNVVKAELAYGHDFPKAEPIAEDRLAIFEPLALITPDGSFEMKQVGENYAYELEKELGKGSYIVTGTYKPTFWSKGPDGWAQKNKKEMPDATYSQLAIMLGKTVVNVEGSDSDDFITKPVGQKLEIVPLKNPAKVKAGETLPVQILLDGKPVKMAEVKATFAGFAENKEHQAFCGKADIKGIIDIVVLKEGQWIAKVSHKAPYEDPAVSDELTVYSTFTFNVGK